MSTIAIGDIHGHRPALEDLLSKIAGEQFLSTLNSQL
jgi:hypothetical protein